MSKKASAIEQLEEQVKHKITEIELVNERNNEVEQLNHKLKEAVDAYKHKVG